MQKPVNLARIQNSFTIQAENFESPDMNFSKQEYLNYTIKSIVPGQGDNVLEVAAGTCACGRAIAPFVNSVTCVDATPAMLRAGAELSRQENIKNISFVNGFAEALPFAGSLFDIVITRLSFHHFAEMEKPFEQMNRVLKAGGKLVIIDMEAADEKLRIIQDRIEIMRDPSHEHNRSKAEFLTLYHRYNYQMKKTECTEIPVSLQAWMDHTKTSEEVQEEIKGLMQRNIINNIPTGFAPYIKDGEIYFDQRWLFMMGIKVSL